MTKTNAMRLLDAAKIAYDVKEYEVDENDLSGVHIASQIGLPFEQVFKTLTAKGDKTGVLVFCIPVHKEIDLKKAAAVTGNKKVELLHVKDLLATTGYVRGGCSPIGMKKKFPTFIEQSAMDFDRITVSAGMKGAQLLLSVDDLLKFTGAKLCQIV
ncbi:MAG: Cys-tRNA(Pro) deacylase [Ruminococcaceae bacterium]|nr:Cys-tRNA(Pro) deacylase [Oscillospiraceae bacterium]